MNYWVKLDQWFCVVHLRFFKNGLKKQTQNKKKLKIQSLHSIVLSVCLLTQFVAVWCNVVQHLIICIWFPMW